MRKSLRWPTWLAVFAVCLGCAAAPRPPSGGGDHGAHAAAGRPVPPASEDAYARTRPSEAGLFRASYRSDAETLPLNVLQAWTLALETAGGEPVRDAEIAVETSMPEHGHGMPTTPAVTVNNGDGTYRVEGLKFSMPGWWVLRFKIRAGGRDDAVVFHVRLK